ncbi:uncharacterized protein CG4449 [Schistocerca serialis cubense]|uniref:uncharacterized protein CG4449 n=1 Tax=Schistocerca serialis cubense TaxID=2023355 RepID=UPI00214E9A28|nr:uncharacterized protein CG4449 [Schistocerca serialis cubense]XP_049941975.1 uncharacterized protein CG4449 [Schistocerca serialis cubense]
MSDTDDDDSSENFSLFPDISKEYQRWMNTDLSEFMLKRDPNALPLKPVENDVETRQCKRRKGDTSTQNEEEDDDVIEIRDTSPEPARQTRSVTRGRGRGRARGRARARARGRGRGHARGTGGDSRGRKSMPVITNEVPLTVEDSDEENTDNVNNVSLEIPDELENYEMSVKVMWKSKDIHRFKIRKHQKMKTIFQFFSDMESVTEDKLLFMLNDKQIHPDDTPGSLKLTVVDFIDGGVTTLNAPAPTAVTHEEDLNDEDVELKILCKDRKKPLTVKIHKDEKMKVLMIKVAEMLEMPQERLKFMFDGELLNSSDTAVDLELEGGECIEVNVIA